MRLFGESKFLLLIIAISCSFVQLLAHDYSSLFISIQHSFDDKPLRLSSLRYENAAQETFSVSRLSYLIDEIELQKEEDGTWVQVKNSTAFIDLGKRRTRFELKDVPAIKYTAMRFSIGVEETANHGDPAQYAADHPLNTNLNNLHWTWKEGYIFLALEGRFRDDAKELNGYVYHFANDANYTQITLPLKLDLHEQTLMEMEFNVAAVLNFPTPISFQKDGPSTHSHPGDPIAAAIKKNLNAAFSIQSIKSANPQREMPQLDPIDMPEKFTPFPFRMSKSFPQPYLPTDNPLIVERVELGKKLFFDPLLSHTDTVSCATCHLPDAGFSDPRTLSHGISAEPTRRHSMPLFNLAWKDAFFWDGRVATLREQVLHPIEDPVEMGLPLTELTEKLSKHPEYPKLFNKAFASGNITSENVGLALENYLFTLTSYKSKFDQSMQGKAQLTEQEKRGFELFMTEFEPRSNRHGADCFHCHGGPLFSDHQFHNNGLVQLEDLGRYEFTKNPADKNKFSTPSLRNIALTAPYMHDGRFDTLEAVLHHYNQGIEPSPTLDPNLAKHPQPGLGLSDEDIAAIAAFLRTLTDETLQTLN